MTVNSNLPCFSDRIIFSANVVFIYLQCLNDYTNESLRTGDWWNTIHSVNGSWSNNYYQYWEIFTKDFLGNLWDVLEILKPSSQKFQKILKKCFLGTIYKDVFGCFKSSLKYGSLLPVWRFKRIITCFCDVLWWIYILQRFNYFKERRYCYYYYLTIIIFILVYMLTTH